MWGIKGQYVEGGQELVCEKQDDLRTFYRDKAFAYDKTKPSYLQTLAETKTYERHLSRGFMLRSL